MRPVFPLNAHLHAEFFLTRGEDRRGEEEERGERKREEWRSKKGFVVSIIII